MCSCELSKNSFDIFFTIFLQNNSRQLKQSFRTVVPISLHGHYRRTDFFAKLGFWGLSHFVAMSLFSGDNELLSIHHIHIHQGRCFRNFCENFDLVTWYFLDFPCVLSKDWQHFAASCKILSVWYSARWLVILEAQVKLKSAQMNEKRKTYESKPWFANKMSLHVTHFCWFCWSWHLALHVSFYDTNMRIILIYINL